MGAKHHHLVGNWMKGVVEATAVGARMFQQLAADVVAAPVSLVVVVVQEQSSLSHTHRPEHRHNLLVTAYSASTPQLESLVSLDVTWCLRAVFPHPRSNQDKSVCVSTS
jgi:hypothetical protein